MRLPSWKASISPSASCISLKVKPGQRVLEVGTGSGFTAAVMGRIAERVLTIDRYKTLTTGSAAAHGHSSVCATSSSARPTAASGLQGEGTFDRILVTAAFTAMPRFYADQLVSGGSMIAPLMMSENRVPHGPADQDRQPLRTRGAFRRSLSADRAAARLLCFEAYSG